MTTSSLRKLGGSIVLTVPPALLGLLDLKAGEKVELDVENGALVVRPRRRPHYTMAELLAVSEYPAEPDAESRDWAAGGATGREIL
ncbi:AbrB/MazE/SpoVT family DNA-binding domain-containing protein [Gluconobacter sp. GP1]|uniref:AbrB/MazE/SpoVT family DNA-binding domain-containing protein n=1 Tax=unclassified Gluconobacter TaxID=2644261 RepID=UPI00293F1489|nr:AbrB/MazE/SpoVT family DNA-binding domain-containing protein [Gluconobacter sp. GP1]